MIMLKKVPYNSGLISIGNAAVYDGKPVYTDGRVAYGWHFTPQQKASEMNDYKGLWVGEYGNSDTGTFGEGAYKLVQRGIELGNVLRGRNIRALEYCLPWVGRYRNAWDVQTIDGQQGYSYGQYEDIIAFTPDGRLLTYITLPYKLYQYTAAGVKTETDLSQIDKCKDRFNQNSQEWGVIPGIMQLATPDGCYIYAKLKQQAGQPAPVYKEYFAGGGALIERSYPQEFFIDGYNGQNGQPVVKIRLADMALTIGGKTYTGDPLGLLQNVTSSTIINPASVHAYVLQDRQENVKGAYVMKSEESTGHLWLFDNATETFKSKEYAGLRHCWNLAMLEKRLIITDFENNVNS